MKKFDNDVLYEDLGDLINHEVDKVTGRSWRDWYMRTFYKLGKDEVLRLASIARADGKHKKRYFSKLLKDATKKGAYSRQ